MRSTRDAFEGSSPKPASPAQAPPQPAPAARPTLKETVREKLAAAAEELREKVEDAGQKAAAAGQIVRREVTEAAQAVEQRLAPVVAPVKEKVDEASQRIGRRVEEAVEGVRDRVAPAITGAGRALRAGAAALSARGGGPAEERRKWLLEERRKLETRLAPFRRRMEKRFDPETLPAAVRKWRPAIQRIDELCATLKRKKNLELLVALLEKIVPAKGKRRAPVAGPEALTLVEIFLQRVSIDLPALEKVASRAGLKTTFLLGASGDAALVLGVDGAVGFAYTFGSRVLRWYWQLGQTVGVPVPGLAEASVGVAIQMGLESGGPEAQEGRLAQVEIEAEIGAKGVIGASIDASTFRPTGFKIGAGVGGGATPTIVEAHLLIGEGRTGTIFDWRNAKAEARRALSEIRGPPLPA